MHLFVNWPKYFPSLWWKAEGIIFDTYDFFVVEMMRRKENEKNVPDIRKGFWKNFVSNDEPI